MDRRGFLQAFLGVAAGAALPEKALTFLAQSGSLTDIEFVGGVELNFTSAELTLSLDNFSTLYLQPAMKALSESIDKDVLDDLA